MNPAYGIIMWIIIGALAGWIGSMIMGTNAKQGGLMNIIVGVVGAVVGGFLARSVFGDSSLNNGFFASFFVALLGACVLIGLVKLVTRDRHGTLSP
jgi:uncharacterized membrane protein YeaQ/YmgE (transglycosylase-associated protein family)